MTRPLLGISACTRRLGEETAQAVIDRYVIAAMRHADADAVLIPALPDLVDADNLVARLEGVLLTGSPSNVAPERYGEPGGDGPFDPGRDAVTAALIAAARRRAKPLFGICRGFQEINVALGGTLRRDLGTTPLPHHAAEGASLTAMFAHRHPVALTPGGVLAGAFGAAEIEVNSVHYQGIARLAPGLAVEAIAPDGQVEAASAASLVAVQWHPEWDPDEPASTAFFHLLGCALRGALSSERPGA